MKNKNINMKQLKTDYIITVKLMMKKSNIFNQCNNVNCILLQAVKGKHKSYHS